MVIPSIMLLFVEGLVGAALARRWSFSKTWWEVVVSCWHLRGQCVPTAPDSRLPKRDLWMLRFFCFPLNRWNEIKQMFRLGLPILDQR